MSVIMTLRVSGDPNNLEQLAGENQEMIPGISPEITFWRKLETNDEVGWN